MGMMTAESDRALLGRVADGDSQAFGQLFDRHSKPIYNYCFRRTADWGIAEDLTSATFLEAWRLRNVALNRDSALPWLLGVATNLLRNQRRGLRRYREALGRVPPTDQEPDFAEALTQRLDDERRMGEILVLLRKLHPRDRELIHLCVWSGVSYEDASVALDVPVGTVRSRLSRARARLRELLSNDDMPETSGASKEER